MTHAHLDTPIELLQQLQQLPHCNGRFTSDSRRVSHGTVFVAYPGALMDGRDFIDAALLAGACAVLVEARGWSGRKLSVPCFAIENLRRRYARIVDKMAGLPSEKIKLIGVTGTNGKTSVSTWIAQALEALGKPCGVIGTLGIGRPHALATSNNTTPDAAIVVESLVKNLQQGCLYAAIEVSSHALDQDRVTGLHFNTAIFTNLTQDHLDYHHTLAAYGAAKAKLFAYPSLANAILNADDPFATTIETATHVNRITYSTTEVSGAQIYPQQIDFHQQGMRGAIVTPWGVVEINVPLLGAFNLSNLMAVIACLGVQGFSSAEISRAVAQVRSVRGRMEKIGLAQNQKSTTTVVVDYAHTPDALEKCLRTLRALQKAGHLHVVFGCGGDRDALKRPIMGQIAGELADRVWLTSDNPRSENPDTILGQIASGIAATKQAKLQIISDRAKAIGAAIRAASSDDIVLIAGKGHETTQEINGVYLPFDDAQIAREYLQC